MLVCACDVYNAIVDWWQDDIKELDRKLKLEIHQVSQMKEELAFKDALICKANIARANLEKEMELVKVDIFTAQRSPVARYMLSSSVCLFVTRWYF